MPRIGTPASRRSAISSSRPRSRIRSIARGKAPTPGQDHAVGGAHLGGVAGDRRGGADVLERLLDRAQVAHPVVEDRDPRAHSLSVPLVEGTPLSSRVDRDRDAQGAGEGLEAGLDHVVGVGAVADRDVQGQLGAVGDGAEELLGQLGVEAGDRGRRQLGVEDAERAAGDVDRALGQRLVHRHQRRAVAADPGAVAERLVERLAEHDADVLHRVVGAGLEVAARLDLQAEPAVAGEQVEHVVEEADAGLGARLSPVEVEREPDLRLGRAALSARRFGSSS